MFHGRKVRFELFRLSVHFRVRMGLEKVQLPLLCARFFIEKECVHERACSIGIICRFSYTRMQGFQQGSGIRKVFNSRLPNMTNWVEGCG